MPTDYTQIQQEHGLTETQTRFLANLVDGGMGRQQAYMEARGGEVTPGSAAAMATRDLNDVKNNVSAAYRDLLDAKYQKTAETFALSKDKIVKDLERIKLEAIEAIEDKRPGGGTYNGYVRACELQGKAIGMFSTVHHKHEHELAVVDTGSLLESISAQNPQLAAMLGEQLGETLEGEYSVKSDD